MATEIWKRGAGELASAIRDREFSAVEVVEAHLARIAEVNPAINAVTLVLEEDALGAAAEVDRAIERGDEVGPLAGVPMTVKENIDLLGSATTQGLPAFADAIPPADCPHVAQLKRAGAIPIGRTNLPDLGLRWHTVNALRGATVNPWNPSRTTGGSSGGDAAALATGMTPLGLGNDYGGSLRVPSQFCGTTAIRPTLGRVPQASALLPMEAPITAQMMAVQGPMARHVSDLRLALELMSGPDARDPWWVPAPLDVPRSADSVRVAVTTDPAGLGAAPEVIASVRAAADVLANAGFIVEEAEPPDVERGAQMWTSLINTEVNTELLPILKPLATEEATGFLETMMELGPPLSLADYMRGLADRNAIARDWALFAERYPLVLGPVSTRPPFEVGEDLSNTADVLRSMRLTAVINLLGLPSVAVPVGVENGLPQGVQLIGSRFAESLCLDAGQAVESALGVLTPIDPIG